MKPISDNILRLMNKADREPLGKAGVTSADALEKQVAKSERDLQKIISSYLRLQGIWFAWSRMDKKTTCFLGQPDFLLALKITTNHARPIALEIKFEKGKLTPEQEDVREAMLRNGWEHYVVRSLQEVIEIINRGKTA